jgi:hypothetical protein
MPFKSQAQRRFMHAAEDRGDIKPSTVKEFDEASKGKKIPERLHPKGTYTKLSKFMKKK